MSQFRSALFLFGCSVLGCQPAVKEVGAPQQSELDQYLADNPEEAYEDMAELEDE